MAGNLKLGERSMPSGTPLTSFRQELRECRGTSGDLSNTPNIPPTLAPAQKPKVKKGQLGSIEKQLLGGVPGPKDHAETLWHKEKSSPQGQEERERAWGRVGTWKSECPARRSQGSGGPTAVCAGSRRSRVRPVRLCASRCQARQISHLLSQSPATAR